MKAVAIIVFLTSCNFFSSAQYNHYYGNIHAHSDYSDGNKDLKDSIDTPVECYKYANESVNFDFLGISEHNHSKAKGRSGPNNPDDVSINVELFHEGLKQADTSSIDGKFVALYGLEFGVIEKGGHVLIYGIDSLINWEAGNTEIHNDKFDYTSLFNKIAASEKGFAYLAHPHKEDYADLANKEYNSTFDSAIIGIAVRSGPAFSKHTNYRKKPSNSYQKQYFSFLARGYHLAPGADHDTHYTNFGRSTQTRLVVLSNSLTRDSVFDAFYKRRFYCTDDYNVKVDFSLHNKFPMGSITSGSINPVLSLSISDANASEKVKKFFIYRGIAGSNEPPERIKTVRNDSDFTAEFQQPERNREYYYLIKIFQKDGDKIWTAPIWYTKE